MRSREDAITAKKILEDDDILTMRGDFVKADGKLLRIFATPRAQESTCYS